jgi:hypothetical protein
MVVWMVETRLPLLYTRPLTCLLQVSLGVGDSSLGVFLTMKTMQASNPAVAVSCTMLLSQFRICTKGNEPIPAGHRTMHEQLSQSVLSLSRACLRSNLSCLPP